MQRILERPESEDAQSTVYHGQSMLGRSPSRFSSIEQPPQASSSMNLTEQSIANPNGRLIFSQDQNRDSI